MFNFFKKKSTGSINKVASFSTNDSALKSYQETAQEQLPYLIEFMTENGDGVEKFGEELFKYAVKSKFTEGDNAEHMWVKVSEFKNGQFVGELNNKPNTMKLVKYGDTVTVLKADVEDWVLQDLLTNTKVGGFSSGHIRNAANQKDNSSK